MEIPGDSLAVTSFIAPKVTNYTQKEFVLHVFRGELVSDPDTLFVTITPSPKMPTIQQFGDTLLASKASVYQWYKESKELSGATDSVLYIYQSGNYRVKVMDNKGCVSDISDALYVIYSSVGGIDYKLKIYPNPTTGVVNIFGLPLDKRTSIKVFNMNAQILYNCEIENSNARIDFSSFNQGQYIIVVGNDNQHSIKIMKR
jgi:hypothetical protein